MEGIQNCPITGHASKTIKTGDFTEFNCPECGRYRVSGTVLVTHAEHDEELKGELMRAKLRAAPGETPMIANIG
jgi:hypothetical protein